MNKLTRVDMLGLDDLMKEVLGVIESRNEFPESLLYVNYDYIYRPEGLFDDLIMDSQYKGYDTVFTAFTDFGHYWLRNGKDEFKQSDPSMKSREERDPIYRALYGLGCLSSSSVIRSGNMVGGKIGILPIADLKNTLRLRDLKSKEIYKVFQKHWGVNEVEMV